VGRGLVVGQLVVNAQLQFRDLTLGYDRHPAVHHLSGGVEAGALMAVVGPNGAGKSTLFKGIVGLLTPLSGRIELNGLKRRDIAYLPQIVDIDRSFPINVYDMVAMGLWRSTGLFGAIAGKGRAQIHDAIGAIGLTGFEDRPIGTLSGGQMQRVLFARLLLQDARLIVLDEPFNAVDAKTVADLCALVQRWHGERRTVIAALHDLELVRAHFPEALLLARAPVAWGPTCDVLTPDNLLKARRMCEAFDENARECRVDAA
jgi:zinc/manganese transport system ATP-binding protein